MRSHRIEERRGEVLALWEAQQDITLDDLRVALGGISLSVANSTLQRLFARHGITWGKRPGA
ncbi:transposase [Novosphingobium chloroacetimidivorans]|uniref:Transposase n=1 Tax=Novosphingobium chloroacetimidivorans TaxID=1428314 RepID=A0A7W7NZ67_9SPHN|nr:hypothetical protein [Novosphingobium chloroacetimidivorans]MBB4860960.1 transposase [Novosphingobium chloroacetimidivorans]